MDEQRARDYLAHGLVEIEAKGPAWQRREDYFRGKQDLPFAPEGVNREYLELREMAIANWCGLAIGAPIQRQRAEGFRTGRNQEADAATWNEIWQPNKLDSRQRIVYTEKMVHGRGIMSVWPDPANLRTPRIRPECSKNIHIEMDPEDAFSRKWAVKTITVNDYSGGSTSGAAAPQRTAAFVYDRTTWARFERNGGPSVGIASGSWELVAGGAHPLGDVPFVPFDNRPDSTGKPQSALEPLMPAQDAINTIRFNTLLAMQFSAFRQRVFVGYDPVIRDGSGEVVWAKNPDGSDLLDSSGNRVPSVRSPGRVGVDRALVFPGGDTKVFDLPESNLSNYIEVLGEFLTQMFAVGQVPPQYLLSRMANLSGDALAGAESTLRSLKDELELADGEAIEEVMRLANRARGDGAPDLASEVIWADTEAKSFAQVVDGVQKLIASGFPSEAAFEMLPGATPPKVKRWMDMRDEEQSSDPFLKATRALEGTATPVASDDPASNG